MRRERGVWDLASGDTGGVGIAAWLIEQGIV